MVGEERSERKADRYVYVCPCCGPTGRRWGIFWGFLLTAIGAVLLLDNLEVIPWDWWDFLIPLLLVAWGINILWRTRRPYGNAENRTTT